MYYLVCCGFPLVRSLLVVPKTDRHKFLRILIGKKFHVCKRSLPAKLAKMIDDLVFQNPNKPASLRGTGPEFFVAAHTGEKCFLHQVFGHFGFAHTHYSVSIKTLTVVVQPT